MPAQRESFDNYLASTQKHARSARLFGLAITVIPVLVALIALFITISQIKNAQSELVQARNDLANAHTELNNVKEELIRKREEIKNIAAAQNLSPDELLQAVKLYNYGWPKEKIEKASTDKPRVERSLKANNELQNLAKPSESDRRKSITVAYFPKNVDAGKVDAALKDFGFNLIRLNPRIKDTPTNAIYFGNKVNLDDVKIIAYTLIRAGVEIKGIFRIDKDTDLPWPPGVAKDSLIEVVANANSDFLKRPPMTIEQIRSAKDFTTKDY
jgi:vacuolar-type H+-ATPase subunit I/STV1